MIPDITAILVTYNSAGVVAQALAALCGQPEIAMVAVVDNCSADNTCTIIGRDFPSVVIIKNPRNDGFGRANNIALAAVTTPYALLVNPDAVMKEGALKALLDASARYPDAAILAPMLYDEHGRLHHSYKRGVFSREKGRDRYATPEGDLCAEFLSGAVWLLNMRLMRKVGFFDDNIFLYYEDDDLCLRVRQAGYGLVLAHAAEAVHLMGASSGKPNPASEIFRQKHMTWSRLYLERKYRGQAAAKRLVFTLCATYSLKAALYGLCFKWEKSARYRGRLAGIAEFHHTALISACAGYSR